MNGDLVVIAKTWIQAPKDATPIDFDEIWDLDGSTHRGTAKLRLERVFRDLCKYELAKRLDMVEMSTMVEIGNGAKRNSSTYLMSYNVFKHYISSSQTERGYKTRAKLHQAEEELQAIKAGGHVAFDPTDPKQLLGYLHDYATKLVEATDKLAVAEPKAQVYDDIMKSDSNVTFRETAKTLNILEPTLKNLLVTPREKGGWGLWYYLGGNAVPRAEYGEAGQKLFVVVPVLANNKMRLQVKTTPKGLLYLCSLWNERLNSNQLSFGNG